MNDKPRTITWIPNYHPIHRMYPRTKSLIETHKESTARFAKENDCIAHYTKGNSKHFQSVRYTCTEETFILIKLKYPNVIETYTQNETNTV